MVNVFFYLGFKDEEIEAVVRLRNFPQITLVESGGARLLMQAIYLQNLQNS